MVFDEKVTSYYNNRIKQVFVYVTSRCQLRCKQCLYKPLLCDNSIDVDFYVLKDMLSKFHEFGAYKLSLLGGEPTLYYDKVNNRRLGDIIVAAKEIGYKYVRIDTNGQFDSSFLEDEKIKKLDEITFSVDGHDKSTNDIVRGNGTFVKCLDNLKLAIRLGYKVQITSCIHKFSCPNSNDGIKNIEDMISFAEELGVFSINFHPIIKVGIARDNWIESTDISSSVWKAIYKKVANFDILNKKKIKVRMPMRFAERKQVLSNREKYFYCPLEMGERALIMPDGQIKVCAFTIGTDNCVARYTNNKVIFEERNNETNLIGSLEPYQVCYNQIINSDIDVPLCMSYKPEQNEIVWKDISNGKFFKGEQ